MLGLSWRPHQDDFHFTTWPSFNKKITKRTITSEIAQLFDPLGLLSPVLVRAKMFIQELWLLKTGWDDELPVTVQERWNAFRKELPILAELYIPRWLHLSASLTSIELHGFSDASQLAMAAVVYIRVVYNEQVTVRLIAAKTKVAPLKRLTIPRLELTAALLLTRLTSYILRALELFNAPAYLWTDSTITLTWISAHPSRWKDYVRNRVLQIQEAAPQAIWRFVSGKENPADCASRGLHADQLKHHPLWWKGPFWLTQESSQWPTLSYEISPESNLEARPSSLLTVSTSPLSTYWDLADRYSSLSQLLRITAICKRVIVRFRHQDDRTPFIPLTPNELQWSTKFWVRIIQEHAFFHEKKIILNKDQLPKSNPLTKLTPYIDEDGLLRVGGRLQHSQLENDTGNIRTFFHDILHSLRS